MPATGRKRVARVAAIVAIACGLVVAGAMLASEFLFRQPLVEACHATANGIRTELPLEEAQNAALISAVSVRRGLPPRAASIALATAYQESGLRNIDYGHLDSVGLFQQRPSQGWGTVEQIQDPYYATGRFYTALVKVPGYTGMDIAAAAQRVQLSADGSAYSQHESNARVLASALTGQKPAAFSCDFQPTEQRGATTTADLSAELAKAYGNERGRVTGATVGQGGNDGLSVKNTAALVLDVPVRTGEGRFGWSVAQWSVAYAKRFGIASISYGGRTWTADRSKDGWRTDQAAAPTRVRIVVGSPSRPG
ncbi:hypothetical protein [Actinopolymorpha rutila]|uniref:Heavy metal transporter n=1 Tax=Actinopolymorpha rutila TaxID=446787 RepID=A0A852ZAN8_9ACTN|nr:hypothetical protein [Actinopolymorpha rutila]NYH88872.1 hypothetical protein [Actinopolymorpha rutila]